MVPFEVTSTARVWSQIFSITSHHSLDAVQCWHCPAYSSIICCFLASKYLHSNIPNAQNLSLSWNNNKFKFLVQFLLVLGISQNAALLRVCWSDLQRWEAEMTGGVFVEMVVTGHWTPDLGDHQPPGTDSSWPHHVPQCTQTILWKKMWPLH